MPEISPSTDAGETKHFLDFLMLDGSSAPALRSDQSIAPDSRPDAQIFLANPAGLSANEPSSQQALADNEGDFSGMVDFASYFGAFAGVFGNDVADTNALPDAAPAENANSAETSGNSAFATHLSPTFLAFSPAEAVNIRQPSLPLTTTTAGKIHDSPTAANGQIIPLKTQAFSSEIQQQATSHSHIAGFTGFYGTLAAPDIALDDVAPWTTFSFILQHFLSHMHCLVPLVHKPSFAQDLMMGRAKRDREFRALVFGLVSLTIGQSPLSKMAHISRPELERLHRDCHRASMVLLNRSFRKPTVTQLIVLMSSVLFPYDYICAHLRRPPDAITTMHP